MSTNNTPSPDDWAPFIVKQAQRDAPFMSSDMLSMLRKTTAVGMGQAGNSQSIIFHDIEESPRCIYVSTNATFQIISNATFDGTPGANRSVDFQIPWRVHQGYNGVSAIVMAKTNINRPVSIRMVVGDLLTSTTAITGPNCPPALPQSADASTLYDSEGVRFWNLTSNVMFHCHTEVDVATDPECTIKFELQPLRPTGRLSGHDFKQNRNIYMMFQAVTLYDRKYDKG